MYVISYDIENDKIRAKIAKELENYGRRVQYSVFECRIDQKRFEILYEKLAKLMEKEETGNIRFYHLCAICDGNVAIMGIKKEDPVNEELIII